MVGAGDFKNGVTFEMEGNVFQVVEFQHVKPGKGAAFVRTKLKNVITGAVIEKTFSPTDKYENAYVERKDMQYLYNDGELYYFMDLETYEQLPLEESKLGDNFRFVKEEMLCKIISYKGNVFGVDSRVTQQQVHPNPQRLKQAHRSKFRSSSTSATFSRSTPEQVNILKEQNSNFYI